MRGLRWLIGSRPTLPGSPSQAASCERVALWEKTRAVFPKLLAYAAVRTLSSASATQTAVAIELNFKEREMANGPTRIQATEVV